MVVMKTLRREAAGINGSQKVAMLRHTGVVRRDIPSKLVSALLTLKRVERAGWVEMCLNDVESVADHSFSLAALAMVYARRHGLNLSKVLEMALIHDVAEAYTGDLTPRIKKRIPRHLLERLETAILERIFSELPDNLRRHYLALYREYCAGDSAEARAVHMLDKLEMLCEAGMLMAERRANRGQLRKMTGGSKLT